MAATWEDNYLAHHGIKGQKWGVRRYQNEDGTLTEAGKKHYGVDVGGNEKLQKKLARDTKVMRKALDKTDIELQKTNAEKYDARARTAARIGSAATAVGLVVSALGERDRKIGYDKKGQHEKTATEHSKDADFWRVKEGGWKLGDDGYYHKSMGNGVSLKESREGLNEMRDWASGQALMATFKKWGVEDNLNKLNTILPAAQAASIGVAAGAYSAAGYNKIRSAVSKSRTTEKGHAKAVANATKKYNKMLNTYQNTPLLSVFKTQIKLYKEMHPNTELSDKEIMNNMI